MSKRFLSTSETPRLLAVLSCALALLAANPGMGSGRVEASPGLMHTVGLAEQVSEGSWEPVVLDSHTRFARSFPDARPADAARPQQSAEGSQALAAWQRWGNLIAFHFAALFTQPSVPALGEAIYALPSMTNSQTEAAARSLRADSPPRYESEFAIVHHLLSPPSGT